MTSTWSSSSPTSNLTSPCSGFEPGGTIITFLVVALLQNSQTRSDQALQHKLNAIADGMADLMVHLFEGHDDDGLLAVGLQQHESSGKGPSDPRAS